jgi:hypothetical protein
MKTWLETTWAAILPELQAFAQEQFAALLILALVLFLILAWKLGRQPKHIVAYSTDDGEVWVTRSAIIELIKTTCELLPSVQKPSVKMRIKGRQTHFNIAFKLASNGQLRLIESQLQGQLRQALEANFGLQNLGKINLIATGFKQDKGDFSSAIAQPSHKQLPDSEPTEIPDSDSATSTDSLPSKA